MEPSIPTRFLVISDTHGKAVDLPTEPVDVLIHCGDLTEESKLEEFSTTIQMLRQVDAPLKLVIPGNHDFTLDEPMFRTKLAEAKLLSTDKTVIKEYGSSGDARKLFKESQGITLLDEGTHRFTLANGAKLTVYASPYTPSTSDWGFQYDPQDDHAWNIGRDVNVVMTHGPPHGVFDQVNGNVRAGSPSLFKAIAHSRPQMHCFGHMHAGWGAKNVCWREQFDGEISHFTAIDNSESSLVESLATIQARKFDSDERKAEKKKILENHTLTGHCTASGLEERTIFVNAAIKGCDDDYPEHLPWIVNLTLPKAETSDTSSTPTKTGGNDQFEPKEESRE